MTLPEVLVTLSIAHGHLARRPSRWSTSTMTPTGEVCRARRRGPARPRRWTRSRASCARRSACEHLSRPRPAARDRRRHADSVTFYSRPARHEHDGRAGGRARRRRPRAAHADRSRSAADARDPQHGPGTLVERRVECRDDVTTASYVPPTRRPARSSRRARDRRRTGRARTQRSSATTRTTRRPAVAQPQPRIRRRHRERADRRRASRRSRRSRSPTARSRAKRDGQTGLDRVQQRGLRRAPSTPTPKPDELKIPCL